MKLFTSIFFALSICITVGAQDNIYPAKPNTGIFFITNARIHVGNGTIIENGTIRVEKSKITAVGLNIPIPAGDVRVFNVKGQDVYPGLILPVTDLGLKEIAFSV